ncbi:transcriptional regulator [Methylobacterium nodulans]|uniref:Putative transcriptional regulator n=1 Tax=Methylobacterium nodulans (strain LMG 21967 / CNCM I-2342 / ORS 2060) TaxID=460265 RepID=B8ITM9_METNO|nr:transcriptional regulator [Methylobacterium nodulans]ACL58945.1 putative transcriptional regulator [Methylobacterium nodulans ORS 2060]
MADAINTKPWDPVEYLDSISTVTAYLEAALEDGSPILLAKAVENSIRALGRIEARVVANPLG